MLVARRREQLAEVAKQLRESFEARVELLPADLTRPEDLRRGGGRIQRAPVVGMLTVVGAARGSGLDGRSWRCGRVPQPG